MESQTIVSPLRIGELLNSIDDAVAPSIDPRPSRHFFSRSCKETDESCFPSNPAQCRKLSHQSTKNHEKCDTYSKLSTALASSSYDLSNVKCSVDDSTLLLFGNVHRYFKLQMVIQIARRFAEGRRIDLQVKVVSSPHEFESTDRIDDSVTIRFQEID